MTDRVTAPKVMAELCKHLDYHGNKIDPKIHNHQVILFGERGDNGLVASAREARKRLDELEKTNRKLDNLTWAVITAVVIQLVLAGLKLI